MINTTATNIKELLPIVVLISGNGSNLQAIIDAVARNELSANIRAVISNKKDGSNYYLDNLENGVYFVFINEHSMLGVKKVIVVEENK